MPIPHSTGIIALMRVAQIVVPLVLIGIAVLLFMASPPSASLRAGRPLPEMQFTDLNGETVKIGGAQDKVYLVDFWATWCAPCRQSMPFFQELHEEFGERGLEVVGIALESGSAQNVRSFVQSLRLTYRIVVPENEDEVRSLYQVQSFPTLYIVDRNGTIRYAETGFSNEFRDDIRRVVEQLLNQ